jgi:hypothetical protein
MQVRPPGVEVTLKPVIAAPPSTVGEVQVIVDCVFSKELAITPVGAVGTVDGVTEFEASEALLVPALFVAVTVNV